MNDISTQGKYFLQNNALYVPITKYYRTIDRFRLFLSLLLDRCR